MHPVKLSCWVYSCVKSGLLTGIAITLNCQNRQVVMRLAGQPKLATGPEAARKHYPQVSIA